VDVKSGTFGDKDSPTHYYEWTTLKREEVTESLRKLYKVRFVSCNFSLNIIKSDRIKDVTKHVTEAVESTYMIVIRKSKGARPSGVSRYRGTNIITLVIREIACEDGYYVGLTQNWVQEQATVNKIIWGFYKKNSNF
jgi:hypothetical protein